MTNDIIVNTGRFIVLVLAQVLVFNNIHLFGYINPYVYLLFIMLFPIRKETRGLFLFVSFLMGLTIDLFSDSGGIHAASSLITAYIRPVIVRFAFGNTYEYQTLKIANTVIGQRVVYLSALILTHHFILFSLEIFSFTGLFTIITKTLLTAILTLLLCLMFIALFSRKRS